MYAVTGNVKGNGFLGCKIISGNDMRCLPFLHTEPCWYHADEELWF